jgi:hypothetical protein
MTDEPFTNPGHVPPPHEPQPSELLFEFVRGADQFRCELRDHGMAGVEAQFFQNGEFFASRRFDTRAAAVLWADLERPTIEKGGA